MMFDALGHALLNFGDSSLWFYIACGVVVGIVFGVVPGLNGLVAVALALPLAFMMPPEYIAAFMLSVLAVSSPGGSVTAILLNVPGTGNNVATLLDGFPMTQKGGGTRALGAAQVASASASCLTVLWALIIAPLAFAVVMALRSPDMLFIIVLGISFIAVMAKGSTIKGLISGGLGVILSLVGYHPTTAVERLTFGSLYLWEGIPLVPVALGLFAMPVAIKLAISGGTIAKGDLVLKGMHDVYEGAKDVFRHWSVWLRGSLIGYTFGMIPGAGPAAAVMVAYGQAKATSKHAELYGTGYVEGVIAPESANDSSEAGALLTTLSLGIPGSAGMALVLGGLLLSGMAPGPKMLTEHFDLSLTLIMVVAVASTMGLVIMLPLAPRLEKVAHIPGRILAPLVMVLSFTGTYAAQELFGDIAVLIGASILGLAMQRFHYNPAALLLGLILGHEFEKYLFISISAYGSLFFLRPISLGIVFIMIAIFAYEPAKRAFQSRLNRKDKG